MNLKECLRSKCEQLTVAEKIAKSQMMEAHNIIKSLCQNSTEKVRTIVLFNFFQLQASSYRFFSNTLRTNLYNGINSSMNLSHVVKFFYSITRLIIFVNRIH